MASKILFGIIASLLVGVISAFFVLFIAYYGLLAMFYPFFVLFLASITALLYKRWICEEKWRVYTMLAISVVSACIATFPIVLIERQAKLVAVESSFQFMLTSLPVSSYAHGILFIVLFFAPTFFFSCNAKNTDTSSPQEVEDTSFTKTTSEFKEIEEAVKQRDLAKEKKEEVKASKATSKESKALKKSAKTKTTKKSSS